MKLARILKKSKNRGFTLIEVIISCVLLGVLIIGMFSVITPIMSGVRTKEQNANALMLGEAAEAYIDRSIKNSILVAIFENAKPEDMAEDAAIPKSKQMEEMLAFINSSDNKDAFGGEVYELKCIGIRWGYDAKTQRHKYMITSEKVNKTTGAVDYSKEIPDITNPADPKSYLVFETCFYETLFPTFSFEIMETNVLDDDGNPVMEDDGVTPKMQEIPAIKTIINVYRDANMEELAFQGTGYADLINIKRLQSQNDLYKLFSKKGIQKEDGSFESPTVLTHDADDFGENERPETYIYFITRKLKSATPTTPSSTPSSTTTTT